MGTFKCIQLISNLIKNSGSKHMYLITVIIQGIFVFINVNIIQML